MRRALWILSTPLVAGGLAWAVNAADEHETLVAKAPTPAPGKIYYFSRSGNAPPSDAADAAPARRTYSEMPSESEPDESGAIQRYTRNTPRPAAATPKTRNYYQELFGDDPLDEAPAGKNVRATARRPAASLPERRPAFQYGPNEASPKSDEPLPPEDTPLPPADTSESYELVSGTAADDSDAILHAHHKEPEGPQGNQIVPVQGQIKMPPPRSRTSRTLPGLDDLSGSADDLFDIPAPAPPRTQKAAPRTAARQPAAPRPHAAPQPRGTRQQVISAASRSPSAVKPAAAPEAEEPTPSAPIQQVSAIAAAPAGEVPTISLQWVNYGGLNVGQQCKCGLVVKNTGRLAAKDVVVEAYFPKTVQLLEAEPLPDDTTRRLAWVFDHLGAGEQKTIEITMVPGRRGELSPSATVRFTGVASTVLQVDEPQLSVTVTGPNEISVGETTTQLITVSNPGTGVASDVVIHASIPDGLEYRLGRDVELFIGALGPGESREVRLPLAATAGGRSVLLIEARGANLVQRAQAEIQIAAPRLKVELAGPVLRYVNRPAQYSITVTNEGVAATDNVRIVHLVPEGFEFVRADHSGRFDAGTSSVNWFVGRVEAGQSLQVSVDLNAKRSGQHLHHVQAAGERGSPASAQLETRVDGAAAVVMEVSDLADPVEVETETAYEIRIRNEGTKAAQNLRLGCELPPGVELLGTDGPSDRVIEKGALHFRPLDELPAGAEVVYRLKIKGKTAGNLRLRAKLTSNATGEPLTVEELTKFYAD